MSEEISKEIKKGDLTVGDPFKVLLKFALPLLLSMIFQQIYSLADNIVAGNMGGASSMLASSAINASANIVNIFIAFSVGGTTGAAVIISRLFGQKKYALTKTAIFTSMISLTTLAGILTGVGLLISRPLLIILNTTPDILELADQYLKIYLYGFFFMFIYNISNSIFTGLGDSRTPLYLLIVSSLSNIACDIWFANLFENIVEAVAWATFVCQGVISFVSVILLLRKISMIKTTEKAEIFSFKILGNMTKVAIPSILQQSFISIGNLLIQSLIMSYAITEMFTGFGIALKINSLVTLSIVAMSNAISTFTAQNLGVDDIKRIKKGFIDIIIIGEILVLIFTALLLIIPQQVIGLFISEATDGNRQLIIDYGSRFLYIVVPFYCVVSFKIMCDGILKGSQNMLAFTVCTFTDLFVRVILTYSFAPFMGFDAVCWSFSIGWVITIFVSIFYIIRFFKKNKNLVAKTISE